MGEWWAEHDVSLRTVVAQNPERAAKVTRQPGESVWTEWGEALRNIPVVKQEIPVTSPARTRGRGIGWDGFSSID